MMIAWIFGAAFTGLGALLACALVATLVFNSTSQEPDNYLGELTARWRRRR